jgi:hypothetical protein
MSKTHVVYLFVSWWAFGLIPDFTMMISCGEHSRTTFCVDMCSVAIDTCLGVER